MPRFGADPVAAVRGRITLVRNSGAIGISSADMSLPKLLVADVDDTLLGNPAALYRLTVRLRSDRIGLVPCSSRPVESLRADPAVAALATPSVIGALGTQVELRRSRDMRWQDRFAGFPRDRISTVLEQFGPAHHPSLQSEFKVSHAIARADWLTVARLVHEVDPALRVITSGGSNVDVVPRTAGKANAARYVAAQLGVPWGAVVTAGDAEIDAELIVAGKGIAVGNATTALRAVLAGRGYQAAARYADGVIEGLDHYGCMEEVDEDE